MDVDMETIAIVGMACRVPGAGDVAGFWANLLAGVESIRSAPAGPDEPAGYVPAVGPLDAVTDFDAGFFGMTPRDAEMTDPQQRLFLEQCWLCLEDAACDPARFGGRIGVWGGSGFNAYLLLNVLPRMRAADALREYSAGLLHGNDKDYLASRVAYKLGLTGPAVTVQTACSTSLVAVAQACQSLLDYQCDMALAGGSSLKLPEDWGYVYESGGIQSRDGHCRPFDADASGTVFASGVGVVALKRLSDAVADGDRIHAVILGSAVNSDGARKVGYAAPSVDGQTEVIAEACEAAQVEPATVGYVEAHGTGTAVGDPIELTALDEVYAGVEPGSVLVGSVKSNIGHLNAAGGVIGLIKAALAVRHGQVPATVNFTRPNPRFNPDSPFTVADRTRPFPRRHGVRRAAVSSFGVGGTNAHVVLQQPPEPSPADARGTREHEVVILSAKSGPALAQARDNLVRTLRHAPLDGVAFTLRHGRQQFADRIAVVGHDHDDAIAVLAKATATSARPRDVAFVFPGQGSQFRGMAAGLLRTEPVFAEYVATCAEILRPVLGLDITELIRRGAEPGEDDPLVATELAQPALFVVEYALAQWLRGLDVEPAAMLGHSIGEWTAACLAGVFTLPDALRLVAARGRLIAAQPRGSMLAVELGEAEAGDYESAYLTIAAVNAPQRCVLSGNDEAVAAVAEKLAALGVVCRRLVTSHAFHSALLDDAVAPFAELVSQVELRVPDIPFVSTVTGTWITDAEATDPGYWARQLRAPVRFDGGLEALRDHGDMVVVEVGPGRALGRFAVQAGIPDAVATLPPAQSSRQDTRTVLECVAQLWQLGVQVDWAAFDAPEQRSIVDLPTYPFQRERHWIGAPDAPVSVAPGAVADPVVVVESDPVVDRLIPLWRDLLGIAEVTIDDDLFRLGGDSLLATRLVSRVDRMFGVEVGLAEFLDEPTVRRLADLVTRSSSKNEVEDR